MPSNKKRDERRSFKRAAGRKATQFKPGHKNVSSSGSQSVPEFEPRAGTSGSTTRRNTRLTAREAADVGKIQGSFAPDVTERSQLPYRLRPKPEKEENMHIGSAADENFIVNARRLSELIGHLHANTCKNSKIQVQATTRIGLCVKLTVRCKACGYKSPEMPMSDTVKQSVKGPSAGVLNKMLAVSVLKSKIGIEDARNVLTCLNIKPPATNTVQKCLNSAADEAVGINEQTMEENQKYVAHVLELAGSDPTADVQFDVAYSCRPQGGSEKAAQSFGALIEHSTTRKLPVAVATANKHCRKKGCKHDTCQKNFRSEASIASSERVLLHDTLKKVDDAGHLRVRSITTDGGSQSAKAIRDYYTPRGLKPAIHYKCLVHKIRTLEKNLKQVKLKSVPRGLDKQAFTRKLASCIRVRARLEIVNIRKKSLSDNHFIQSAMNALSNITKCISGNHRLCKLCPEYSTACRGDTYKQLPYGQPLNLDSMDLKALETTLKNAFPVSGLREVSKLYNTNMCESLNAAVFNYAPKSSCYTRNFTALCHSATHSRTVGPGQSTLQIANAVGASIKKTSVTYVNLARKDRSKRYHQARRASPQYKQTRHFQRKKKMNKALFKQSLYSAESSASSSATEHSYGLRT